MKVVLACLLVTVIVIITIGIVSVLKNRERLSKKAYWSVLLIFSLIAIFCAIGLLFVLLFGYNS
ncbi:hypothetical protein [uncultured Ligilactobacillus sp.]|uniref:hypothetical protein n=1 Tax=uncultured Ligilactobacillus sp. TaxID=2837633 RepID=UPI00272B59FC|nr:hypothetical protein [uncultured Ligilactobacillus sp.]